MELVGGREFEFDFVRDDSLIMVFSLDADTFSLSA